MNRNTAVLIPTSLINSSKNYICNGNEGINEQCNCAKELAELKNKIEYLANEQKQLKNRDC